MLNLVSHLVFVSLFLSSSYKQFVSESKLRRSNYGVNMEKHLMKKSVIEKIKKALWWQFFLASLYEVLKVSNCSEPMIFFTISLSFSRINATPHVNQKSSTPLNW
jgi:hypothetical protein